MTLEWEKELLEELAKKLGNFTDDNELAQDENTGLWYLRSSFGVYPGEDARVMAQSLVIELKEGMPQVEIVFNLTYELQQETLGEINKAVSELNYISPGGAFGVRQDTDRLYLRNCWPLDADKSPKKLAEIIFIYYNIMMECIQGGYKGLEAIWTGKKTYEETVKEGMLNRAAH